MDQQYHDKIEELRKKHPSSITEADRAEIRSLRSYFHEHELVAFGIEPEVQPEAPAGETEEDSEETANVNIMTKAQLQAALVEKNIDFPANASKAALAELYEQSLKTDSSDETEEDSEE